MKSKGFFNVIIMNKEIWKSIKGYGGMYKVSNLGRVKSIDRYINHPYFGKIKRKSKILTPGKDKGGYLLVGLRKNNKQKTKYIHRLVAEHFIPKLKNKHQINHIDGNKKNNYISNLEWCNSSENKKHAFKIGLKTFKGENHPRSKLTSKKVKEIRGKYKNKDITQIELAKEYNIDQMQVSRIVNYIRWSHT